MAAEPSLEKEVERRIERRERRGWRNIAAFSAAAFFNDTGTEMTRPFLPLFARSFLGANLLLFSILLAIEELVNRLMKMVTGTISDRMGRKGAVVGGYAFIVGERAGTAFAQVWYHLIPLLSLRQFGRAVRDPAREASVAESFTKERQGRAFGIINTVDTFGAVTGPVVGAILLSIFSTGRIDTIAGIPGEGAFRMLFLVGTIPTLLSAIIIALFLKETWKGKKGPRKPFFATFRQGLALYRNNRSLKVYTTANIIFAMGAVPVMNYMAFVQLGYGGGIVETVFLMVLYSVVHAAASYPGGAVVDALGPVRGQVVTMVIAFASLLSMALMPGLAGFALGFALFGVYEALWITSRRTAIAGVAPVENRAQALGTFSTMYGLSLFVSPLLFGILWSIPTVGATGAFLVCGMFSLVAAIYLVVASRVGAGSGAKEAGGDDE